MSKYLTINDAIRAKIDELVESKGLNKNEYGYTPNATESLNQLAGILGVSSDSQTIADALDVVLSNNSDASSNDSGDAAAIVDRTISAFSNSTVDTIGSYAFTFCSQLSQVNTPNVTTIMPFGFGGVSGVAPNFTTVHFPKCTRIEMGAFLACPSLNTISFPVCSSIGINAFAGCPVLRTAYFLSSSVPYLASTSAFANTAITTGSIYVKASLVSAFQSANNWSAFASAIVGLTDEQIASLNSGE